MSMLLLESTPRPRRSRAGGIASTAAHAALISIAVAMTARTGDGAIAPRIPTPTLIFTAPPPATTTTTTVASSGGLVHVVEHGPALPKIPDFNVEGVSVGPLPPPSTTFSESIGRLPGSGQSVSTSNTSGDEPRSEVEVDKPAALLPATAPRYPELLRSAGVEGRVRVRFVVDSAGRVELATLRILNSTHPLFTSVVRATLPNLRFIPAEAAGRRVRQLVELPFDFSIKE